ncbi:hypothetical protein L3Y34_006043 [Caenorhabditis briggsae]|uniref:G protein-coupled receptor n=1 Tax=Caenorhabditis briggsae TaxID=6238 RepID=A0AAE8ZWI6_CAEBR|nr:hypothetical protein L3Y34_006043 [Caenorhabditis briggsae]
MNKIFEYGGVENIPLYNCSAMSPDAWTSQFGMQRPILGIISISYGSIMEVLFIPSLLAMLDKDLWCLSCYKIMFFVGIVDMLALAMNSISTGVLAFEGAVFCTHSVFIYLAGLCGLGLWCCSCLMNIMLLYTNVAHGVNNLMIMCGTFVFYAYICYVLCKANRTGKSSRIHIQSYQILYQSVAICFINQVSSSVYVVMNFITVPEWLIVVAQLMWQLDHGCPVIIYMTMNPTIRSGCWRKITFRKANLVCADNNNTTLPVP